MRVVEWGNHWGDSTHHPIVHVDPFGSFIPNAPKEES